MGDAVAVIAAHPDDEVLGCGGTISRLAAEGRSVHVLLMADGESSRAESGYLPSEGGRIASRNAAACRAAEILSCASVDCVGLPDNRLDSLVLLDVIRHVEAFLARYQPCTVLTHHVGDLNVDHRITHQAVVTACRPQSGHSVREILFFEIPSSTEWQTPGSGPYFAPNWFVDISAFMPLKLDALRAYSAELRAFPHPRSLEGVEALAAWRGATVGFVAAEAFILGRKLIS